MKLQLDDSGLPTVWVTEGEGRNRDRRLWGFSVPHDQDWSLLFLQARARGGGNGREGEGKRSASSVKLGPLLF